MLFGLNLSFLQQQYDDAARLLASDQSIERSKRIEIQRKVAILQEVIAALLLYQKLDIDRQVCIKEQALDDAANENSSEYLILLKEELLQIDKEMHSISQNLEDILFPVDTRDNKSCYIEIRAGAGGQEASIFAHDLLKMYTAYAIKNGWTVSLHSMSSTDLGGVREGILYISGKKAFKAFKYESGVHRVQRVPVTEAAGRIHTSTVTVAVMAEADEIDVKIAPNDLRIDTFRSSGAGGQHVNTTDSAIRITHIPTGIVVTCQDERSQLKNKTKALKELRSRIMEAELQKAESERCSERKNMVGTGDRAEKIRTYNYPQNRITDHRIDLTLKKLDIIMAGDLSELIDGMTESSNKNKTISPELSFLIS